MGIDAEAYMSGAIPSLNRGGSWRQDDQHSSNQSATSYAHATTPSIFPRPSQIVPQPPPSMGGNRNNGHFALAHHPMGVLPPFAPSRLGAMTVRPMTPAGSGVARSSAGGGGSIVSGKAPTVGPTKHIGWANLHVGGYRSSPTSPTAPSGATFIASQANSQYGVKAPVGQHTTPLVSPRLAEPVWEYDSGSPKPLTAEPDYFALPASPGMVSAPHTPTGGVHQDSLPPPPKPAPQSPRPRVESQKAPRPALSRRHTHDRYSPEALAAIERAERSGRVDSKSLGRSRAKSGLRKPTFDIGSEAGDSYYAPSTKRYAHSVDPPSTSLQSDQSPSRPNTSRRSTAGSGFSPSADGVTRSFAEKRFKNRSHPALSTINSTASSSQTAPTTLTTTRASKSATRPALSALSSTVDFTQTAPTTPTVTSARAPKAARPAPSTVDLTQTAPVTPVSKTSRPQQSIIDMRSLQNALPAIDPSVASAPLTAPPTGGYVTPNTDDGYDRYTAHPAAPVPPRVDITAQTLAEANKPPMGTGLKHVTPDNYRPPGFPKPLKEIGWNRDGPAMRTYGIAWLREGEAEALPGRPAGPRWIQARPPASAAHSGANWWEAGG